MYWESVMPRRFKLYNLASFCGTYFYKSDTDSVNYQILRNKHIDRLLQSLLISLPVVQIAHSIIFFIPLGVFSIQHVYVTPLALHLPFFVKDSKTEFIVNMVLQTILVSYAWIGSFAIEITSCLINHAITVIPDLIQYNLDEFHVEFMNSEQLTVKSVQLLRNSIRQIQDYNR